MNDCLYHTNNNNTIVPSNEPVKDLLQFSCANHNDEDDDEYYIAELWGLYVSDDDDDDFDSSNHIDDRQVSLTQFTTNNDQNDDDDHDSDQALYLPPSYLMKAILAGLYEIPPIHILQYQIGWGRRIRYNYTQNIPLQFNPIPNNITNSNSNNTDDNDVEDYTIQYMTVQRYSHYEYETLNDPFDNNKIQQQSRKRATQCHELDIYRIRFHDNYNKKKASTTSVLNEELYQHALQHEQQNRIGLNVSNAGGTYHGLPNFFMNLTTDTKQSTTTTIHPNNINKQEYDDDDRSNSSSNSDCRYELYQRICSVIEQIEQHQVLQQQKHHQSELNVHSDNMNEKRGTSLPSTSTAASITSSSSLLSLEADTIEGWVNISHGTGSWNRLHTHEGSAWSGVYYVSSPSPLSTTNDTNWNGNIVFKPTPHPLEDTTYTLTSTEANRLRHCSCDLQDTTNNDHHTSSNNHQNVLLPYIDEVQYIMIPPIPGEMIIFPSYIHHCVLPTNGNTNDVNDSYHHNNNTLRISIAFNINWK